MKVFIGYDPREASAFAVACHSLMRRTCLGSDNLYGLYLPELMAKGLYTRPMERRGGKLWDIISTAPMSTEFAISRFLVNYFLQVGPCIVKAQTGLTSKAGWGMFVDCDVLFRADLALLFQLVESDACRKYAVMCVKHQHTPTTEIKMDGQVQTTYPRKNWSSVMFINGDHPANDALTLGMVNTLPGRDLHRFCWLRDGEIGALDVSYNHLVGESLTPEDPDIVHFTSGGPWLPGYDKVEYADEWRTALKDSGYV